jgi:hypothetical protein
MPIAYCEIEFKKMWTEIPIPDETDLPRELENGKPICSAIALHASTG